MQQPRDIVHIILDVEVDEDGDPIQMRFRASSDSGNETPVETLLLALTKAQYDILTGEMFFEDDPEMAVVLRGFSEVGEA